MGIRSAYNGFSVACAASNETLDDTRIRTQPGWAPQYDPERTVAECVEWYRGARPRAR